MGYMGTHILMFVPRFSSVSSGRSVPIKLRAFCVKITLAYSVFLEELSLGLFSVIGLFGNSDFLDNVRREKSVCIRMTLSRERGSNACMGLF